MSLHPFIRYLRIIGKGRHGSRPLTRDEARDALGLILDGVALPQQISAFFVLIRIREETPEEAAGFVDALRERLPALPEPSPATIDWGSYAGKRRQPPWFLLALKVLAQQGEKILLHGIIGPSSNRLYTEQALEPLGIPRVSALSASTSELHRSGLCYISLDDYCPTLRELLHLQQTVGLRTPLHSVARMLNPLSAPLSVHGVFHRKFDQIHQQTAAVLGDERVLAFRGEGGEAEVRPEVETELCLSAGGKTQSLSLASCSDRAVAPTSIDLGQMRRIWYGETHNTYAENAITATLAAVKSAQDPASAHSALEWAKSCWKQRVLD